MIYGDEEFIRRKTEFFRYQRPCSVNRFFLEIIAERKIPQHFKKCVVARCVADIIKIIVFTAGPQTFLRRGRTDIIAGLRTGENIFERDHARIHKQQSRVILRHKRCRWLNSVAAPGIKIQKALTNIFKSGHIVLVTFSDVFIWFWVAI